MLPLTPFYRCFGALFMPSFRILHYVVYYIICIYDAHDTYECRVKACGCDTTAVHIIPVCKTPTENKAAPKYNTKIYIHRMLRMCLYKKPVRCDELQQQTRRINLILREREPKRVILENCFRQTNSDLLSLTLHTLYLYMLAQCFVATSYGFRVWGGGGRHGECYRRAPTLRRYGYNKPSNSTCKVVFRWRILPAHSKQSWS